MMRGINYWTAGDNVNGDKSMDSSINGLMSQGMSILAGFGVLVLVFLVVVISKALKNKKTRS